MMLNHTHPACWAEPACAAHHGYVLRERASIYKSKQKKHGLQMVLDADHWAFAILINWAFNSPHLLAQYLPRRLHPFFLHRFTKTHSMSSNEGTPTHWFTIYTRYMGRHVTTISWFMVLCLASWILLALITWQPRAEQGSPKLFSKASCIEAVMS